MEIEVMRYANASTNVTIPQLGRYLGLGGVPDGFHLAVIGAWCERQACMCLMSAPGIRHYTMDFIEHAKAGRRTHCIRHDQSAQHQRQQRAARLGVHCGVCLLTWGSPAHGRWWRCEGARQRPLPQHQQWFLLRCTIRTVQFKYQR